MNTPVPPQFNPVTLLISLSSSMVLVTIVVLLILLATGFFNAPNVDCQQSEWTACDPVTGQRTRTILTPQSGNGTACRPATEECKVDCVMSEWSTCNKDTKKRTRTVKRKALSGGTACGTLEESCVIPFEPTNALTTTPQEGLNVFYLDRHPKICKDKPINSYTYTKDGDTDKYKYTYICSNNFDIDSKTDKTTPLVNEKNEIVYNLTCAAGEALSYLGFTRNPDKFEYTCLKSKDPMTVCRNVTKPYDRSKSFQENQNSNCNTDEVFNSITFSGDNINYTCCKKN